MALTVHYEFSFYGSKEDLLGKLQWLSVEFLKLPVAKVHEVNFGSRGWELPVEIGPGCEWFAIALAEVGSGHWRGRGFTKTAYATDLKACHLALITILDLCKQAGILGSVHDESTYWETRNISVLSPESGGEQ